MLFWRICTRLATYASSAIQSFDYHYVSVCWLVATCRFPRMLHLILAGWIQNNFHTEGLHRGSDPPVLRL
uniref:Uncharacterized protein n=1 Tax=Anguilla anguilla TaxID=7936 RepID=A0A0E9SNY5_ANGAN